MVKGRVFSRGTWLAVPIVLVLMGAGAAGNQTPSSGSRGSALVKGYGEIPLAFEENVGQTDARVGYLARGAGYGLYLLPGEAVLELSSGEDRALVRMQLLGIEPMPAMEGEEELPWRSNYLKGSDPSRWHTGVRGFERVRYRDVYSGIDLVFYGNQGRLEYDFVVGPGMDPGLIELQFEGTESLTVDEAGDLVLELGAGSMRFERPVAYQLASDGTRTTVAAAFMLKGPDLIGFRIGEFDVQRTLIIDPVLAYSTYLGGSGYDSANGVAVDGSGSAYVVGTTNSVDFPLQNPGQGSLWGATDVFVSKLTPSGSGLVYSTYLGGSNDDQGNAIEVDGAGVAYLTGRTYSSDFPLQSANQSVYSGSGDAFVTALGPTGGTLVYSTYLGSSTADATYDVTLDAAGNAYVAGYGIDRVLVAKYLPSGDRDWILNYGGTTRDEARGIAVDSTGSVYVVGFTDSTDFPVVNAYQSTPAAGTEAFVSKVRSDGGALLYSTYLGGSGNDLAEAVTLDASDQAILAGVTTSTDFPVQNSLQGSSAGGRDVFVSQLSAGGGGLLFSTYLGGGGDDRPRDMALARSGAVVLVGETDSDDFPLVHPIRPNNPASWDGFLTYITPTRASLGYSTYLGGSDNDRANSVALDPWDAAYVVGLTLSTNLLTQNPLQAASAGAEDGFVAKFRPLRERVLMGLGPGPQSPPRSAAAYFDNPTGSFVSSVYSQDHYSTLQAGVNVGGAFLDHSGAEQFLTGPGNVAVFGPHVRGWRDSGQIAKVNFYAYGTLKFGVKVRGVQCDGDRWDEIVTGAGQGAVFGPHVRGFEYDGASLSSTKINFFAYAGYLYGVNVDGADLDGDDLQEVVTGPVFGSGYRTTVRGWDVGPTTGQTSIAAIYFDAFSSPNDHGVTVAIGDLDGDLYAEILCGRGPVSGLPADMRGFNYDGTSVSAVSQLDVSAFGAYTYGLNLVTPDMDGDSVAEICTAPGPDPGAPPVLRCFDWDGGAGAPSPITGLYDMQPFSSSAPSAREGATLGVGDF